MTTIASQFVHKSTDNCKYGLTAVPESLTCFAAKDGVPVPFGLKYSGLRVPAIGERVRVTMNRLGYGTVIAYFREYEWLGVEVALEDQPEWHRKQNGAGKHALVFGIEIQLLGEG